MTNTEAPAYIARDTYAGRHSVHPFRGKRKVGVFEAREIAALAAEGIIWESFGAAYPGRESFGRSRYVADTDGNLHMYNSEGVKVIIHPASRRLRVLTN